MSKGTKEGMPRARIPPPLRPQQDWAWHMLQDKEEVLGLMCAALSSETRPSMSGGGQEGGTEHNGDSVTSLGNQVIPP